MTKSFFDTMYNYIVSIDNDCCSKEDGDFIYQYIKRYLDLKSKEHCHISQLIKLSKSTFLEREVLKEICICILQDYEENLSNSIFYDDIIHSRDCQSFKKYIYYPSLK